MGGRPSAFRIFEARGENDAAREVFMNCSMLHRAPSPEGSAQDDGMRTAHQPGWICK